MRWRIKDTVVGVIGDHCLDEDYRGDYGSVMSREQEDLQVFGIEYSDVRYSGGGAANIVDLLRDWDVRVLPCGVWNIDSDRNSRELYECWRQRFVNTEYMVTGYGTPVFTKYYKGDAGEHIFRTNISMPSPDTVVQERLIHEASVMLRDVDILVVADYDERKQGILTNPIIHTIREIASCPIIGLSRQRIRRMVNYDFLILNEEELEEATDPDSDLDMVSRVFDLFLMTNARHIIVTLKERGAIVYTHTFPKDGRMEIEQTTVDSSAIEGLERINTCGCGDSFTAAFTICYAAGMSIVDSMKRANAAARAQTRKLYGAHPVSQQEWDQEYEALYGGNNGREATDEVISVEQAGASPTG